MSSTDSALPLFNAGFQPGDSPELRLKKSLLIFATGLVSVGAMLWLFLYWQMGPQFSATAPFIFQLLLVANLLIFFKTGHFDFFRYSQLALFLFAPFAVQWSIGNFITASGASLWGLLAPIGAVLIFGVRDSLAWFIAFLFLTGLSGFFDYFLADAVLSSPIRIPVRTSIFFFALNFAAISTIVYLLLRYASLEREKANARLQEAHRQLQAEQDRSEKLLLNILPSAVAERLKKDEQSIADGFADVTVMFADIVNFTRVAEGLTPQQVFTMLNRIFSSFDELAEQHGMEKIKTIGDAYMAVSGVPLPRADHVRVIAEMALEMRSALAEIRDPDDQPFDIRIGIHCGPLVAGVVGSKKFIYDLWGDTVNIASRMESHGLPGRIQVSEAVYHCLRGEYRFEERGPLAVKGRGEMTTYWLIGRK